ncbi:hypothetical protein Tco_0915777, partial [Tanacetum coccineum]
KNTHYPTPSINTVQDEERVEHGDSQEELVFSDAYSFHSVHDEDNDKDAKQHRFVQGPKSKQLLDVEERVRVLEEENTELVWELAQVKIARYKVVREFIPTVVSRLHSNVEYQKSLAVPIGLCFTVGWLGGLSMGRKEEEIATMLTNTSNLDIEGSKVWKDKQRELFIKQDPYVQKSADFYRLPLDEMMKVSLDVPLLLWMIKLGLRSMMMVVVPRR